MAEPYYLVAHGDDNWAPQLKFYHAAAATGSFSPMVNCISELQGLISNDWKVIQMEAFNALNQKTGLYTVLQSGTWTGENMVVKWCYTITINTDSIGGHPSIKYMRGLTEDMFLDGAPAGNLESAIDDLGVALSTNGFTDSHGASVTGAKFGTVSRRGKIRRRLQL